MLQCEHLNLLSIYDLKTQKYGNKILNTAINIRIYPF